MTIKAYGAQAKRRGLAADIDEAALRTDRVNAGSVTFGHQPHLSLRQWRGPDMEELNDIQIRSA